MEERIQIDGEVKLGATLSFPETMSEKVPAVLLIAGTGPGDRDGNIGKKFRLNLYKLIADELAKAGIASLRYDKRGAGESEGTLLKTGFWDLVEDAKRAVQVLKNHQKVDESKVLVLGHSEGTMIATALNQKTRLAGMILVAGGGDTIENATKYQRELAYEDLTQQKGLKGWLIKKFNVVEKSERNVEKMFQKMINSDKDVIRVQLVTKMPAKWFREHFNFNLEEAMKEITCPVLAINGSKDLQTRQETVYKIPELVSGQAEVHVIEDMNHILRNQPGTVSILKIKKAYMAQSSEPLHPELMPVITNWIKKVYN